MEAKIDFLESQVRKLQAELGKNGRSQAEGYGKDIIWSLATADKTKAELAMVTDERDRIKKEKEEREMALIGKLQSMERSYESILQDAMDALASKIETARCKWDSESREMEGRAMQVLLEFGRGTT